METCGVKDANPEHVASPVKTAAQVFELSWRRLAQGCIQADKLLPPVFGTVGF